MRLSSFVVRKKSLTMQNLQAMRDRREQPAAVGRGLRGFLLCGLIFGLAAGHAWPQGAYTMQPPQQQAPVPPPMFQQICSLCHGSDGRGTDRAPTMVNSPHLQSASDSEIATIITKGRGRMPGFPMPASDVATLIRYIRAINATASTSATPAAGDAKAGERIFFGEGACSVCHVVRGRGVSNGPDLSNIANRMRLADMRQVLTNPGANITPGYASATVILNDGTKLLGFLRAQGSHDIVLQTQDGMLHPLLDTEYR